MMGIQDYSRATTLLLHILVRVSCLQLGAYFRQTSGAE
jgi:hypothetical protein